MRVEWFSSKNDVQYPGVSTLPHKKMEVRENNNKENSKGFKSQILT